MERKKGPYCYSNRVSSSKVSLLCKADRFAIRRSTTVMSKNGCGILHDAIVTDELLLCQGSTLVGLDGSHPSSSCSSISQPSPPEDRLQCMTKAKSLSLQVSI